MKIEELFIGSMFHTHAPTYGKKRLIFAPTYGKTLIAYGETSNKI
jgi:hypothetical protein